MSKLTKTSTVIINPDEGYEKGNTSVLKRGTAFRGIEQARIAFCKRFSRYKEFFR